MRECLGRPPRLYLATCAHAGTDWSCSSIRIWSLDAGDAVHVLYGHDSFIYSLAPIPESAGGGLISGGEDRTMRVWRGAFEFA